MGAVGPVQEEIRGRCAGKTAMLFVGGSRAHHYQDLFAEIGMKTVAAPEKYRPRASEQSLRRLENEGLPFKDYEGMMPAMDDRSLVIDDISHYETERMIEIYRPDVFCAGIKEKYVVQKMGVPCKQLHSYDYGGPYAGFRGAINFYREIDRMVNTRIWSMIHAPWENSDPAIDAEYVRRS
jgi:nitrogenase molybdenum-iron protein alpha chain